MTGKQSKGLTHITANGTARMVDVSAKADSARMARATGAIVMEQATLDAIVANTMAKGDVLGAARIAGIMAAKKTAELIPLCHPLALDAVAVRIVAAERGLAVEAEARATGRTGVEMEAMTAVAVACLTLYDMLKSSARGINIENIELVEKRGGKSGMWRRD